jgi:hypothetical protein
MFEKQEQGRLVVAAVPDLDYSEPVWEVWDIFAEIEPQGTPGARRFPVEMRVEPGLLNADVIGALEVVRGSPTALSSTYIGLECVPPTEDRSGTWRCISRDTECFSVKSDGGEVEVAISFSSDLAVENRAIAIRELVDTLRMG